jgi:hypothetical protein
MPDINLTNGGNPYFSQDIGNACIPREGPKAISVSIPFMAANTSFILDLTLSQYQTTISVVQSMYIDNSLSSTDLTITCSGTNQIIIFPAYSQGYIPVTVAKPSRFKFVSSGAQTINVVVLNVPVDAIIWGYENKTRLNQQQVTVSEVGAGGGFTIKLQAPTAEYAIYPNIITYLTGIVWTYSGSTAARISALTITPLNNSTGGSNGSITLYAAVPAGVTAGGSVIVNFDPPLQSPPGQVIQLELGTMGTGNADCSLVANGYWLP